jgi:hypothetical protein
MTTVVFNTGYEHGVANLTINGGGLAFDGGATLPTVVSTQAHTGTYSMYVNVNGTAVQNIAYGHASLPKIAVASFYVFIPTGGLPNAIWTMGTWFATTTAGNCGISISSGAATLRCQIGAGTAVVSSSISLDRWHKIDLIFDMSTSTWAIDWKIDGVAQTQATNAGQSTTDTISYFRFGSSSGTITGQAYIDDVVLSETSGDFPIPETGTQLLMPSADGSHVAGTNVMESNTGANIGVVTAYNLINKLPMSDGSTYIKQIANGSGNYAEVSFADISAYHTGIIGATGILTYTSSGSTANNGATVISKDSFSTSTNLWGSPASPADMSDGNTSAPYYKSLAIANVIDDTTVNALKARVGYSTSSAVNPYWLNVGVEVAYVYYSSTGTLNKSLGSLTDNLTGNITFYKAVGIGGNLNTSWGYSASVIPCDANCAGANCFDVFYFGELTSYPLGYDEFFFPNVNGVYRM